MAALVFDPLAAADDLHQAPNPLLTARVRVVNAEGEPIAGATVAPWAIRSELGHGTWSPDGQGRTVPPTVKTDAEGVAEFDYPKYASPSQQINCQELSCRVEHPDYADTVYNDVPVPQTGGPFEIKLDRGALVRLTPLDENLEPTTSGVHVMWSGDSYWSTKARPQPDGDALVLPRLTAGEEVIRLVRVQGKQATHFSAPLPFVLADGQTMDLMEVLQPTVSVRGRLSDNVPRPIKNGRVSVCVLSRTPGDDIEIFYWNDWAEVAADGSFALEGLPAGEPLQVIGMCDGFLAASGEPPVFATDRERRPTSFQMPQVFQLPAEGATDITLEMEPSGSCEFVVRDTRGEPLDGLEVLTWPNVKWWNGGSQMYCTPLQRSAEAIASVGQTTPDQDDGRYGRPYSADTDAQGHAVVQNLPVRVFSYRVSEPRGIVHRFAVHEGKADASIKGGTQQVTMRPKR